VSKVHDPAGCNGAAVAPTVAKPAAQVSPKVTPAADTPTVAIRTPIHDQPSFALARVVFGIKRGNAITTFPKRFGGLCNSSYARKATLDRASGTWEFGSWTENSVRSTVG